MEHSYSRDWRPSDDPSNLLTRSIMIHRPPQCPSCHIHSHDEGVDLEDFYSPPIPSYNETAAKESMSETENVTNNVKNLNTEDVDWEVMVNKFGWTSQQTQLFDRVTRILDQDRLARYTHKEQQHEPVLRRVVIDKSVQRMRQTLSSVQWDPKLTQFIHGLMMDYLPSSYLSAYLDILQSMKAKIPTLVDKMIFSRTGTHQDILRPVCKKPWEPIIDQKSRKLPNQPVIMIVPSGPTSGAISPRLQKFYALFATMASVVPVQCHVLGLNKQGLPYITEQLMSVTRAKIQEIRAETPNRPIILVGFNAGASLALQIAHVESVSCVVCMGFAYNTVHGVRGSPDDSILDLVTPILFVIGQNSARASQEEIESMREKMQSHTSLVLVGSADDCLRVGKNKRKIEKVSQSMVDNMIMDEVSEFITMCLVNPPGPRVPKKLISTSAATNTSILTNRTNTVGRKRKNTNTGDPDQVTPTKMKAVKIPAPRGRPSLASKERVPQTPLINPTSEALDMAIQSILPSENEAPLPQLVPTTPSSKVMTSYEIVPTGNKSKLEIRQILTGSGHTATVHSSTAGTPIMLPMIQRPMQNVKVIPPNQFLQLKPTQGGQQKVYTLKPATPTLKAISSGSSTPSSQIYTLKTAGGSDNISGQIRGNKIFTFKPGQNATHQLITNKNSIAGGSTSSSPFLINPKKITVMKTITNSDIKSSPDLSSTNIFDIPIVFADSDGNIQESTTMPSTSSPNVAPLVMTSNITQSKLQSIGKIENTFTPISQVGNRSIVINNLLTNRNKQNKVVLINRNAVKNVPNLIRKNIPQLKYTKLMVNPVTKPDQLTPSTSSSTSPSSITLQPQNITKILNSGSIVKTNSAAIGPGQKYQPIIINVDSDKSNAFKNIIKVGDTHIKPTNTILIKSGTGMKPFPMLKPGFLNRNLTVKKIVNIVPQKSVVSTISSSGLTELKTVTTTTAGSAAVIVSQQQQQQQQQPQNPEN